MVLNRLGFRKTTQSNYNIFLPCPLGTFSNYNLFTLEPKCGNMHRLSSRYVVLDSKEHHRDC